MNYYIVLGILPDATQEEVRQAYLKLAKIYHPDKNGSPDATIRMSEINLAYEVLHDGQRRKEYDLENEIANVDTEEEEFVEHYAVDDEEIGEMEATQFGKCTKCNFVNNSGMFVCSVCGYVFDPDVRGRNKKTHYSDNNDEVSFEELDESEEDTLSEIIRCPRCNEINLFSSGSCWQCDLLFEVEEYV